MIKTTIKVPYGDLRTGIKEAYIIIEVAKAIKLQNSVFYEIEHFAIVDDETLAKTLIATSQKSLSVEEYNGLSLAVDSLIQSYDTTEMNPFEIEILRLKIGLFLYLQTDFIKDENGDNTDKVVWNILPSQYEIML